MNLNLQNMNQLSTSSTQKNIKSLYNFIQLNYETTIINYINPIISTQKVNIKRNIKDISNQILITILIHFLFYSKINQLTILNVNNNGVEILIDGRIYNV